MERTLCVEPVIAFTLALAMSERQFYACYAFVAAAYPLARLG